MPDGIPSAPATWWEQFKFGVFMGIGWAVSNAVIAGILWLLSNARNLGHNG
jgi:hypothetical protein